MSNMQRRKGARIEREIVKRHKDINVLARRVARSGVLDRSDEVDLDIFPWGEDFGALVAEVKADQARIPKTVIKWLGENDLLFMRKDGNKDPIVVMPWSTYERLVR